MSMKLDKERLYYRCPTAQLLMAAEIEADRTALSEVNLRGAVARVCECHPLLHCKVLPEADGTAAFVESGTEMAPDIVFESGPFDWNTVTREEERQIFRYEDGELVRFRVFPTEAGAVLLCAASHLICDANALIYLFRDILVALSAPGKRLPEAECRLCSPKELAAGIKLPFSLRMMTRLLNSQWKRSGHDFSFEDYEKLYDSYWRKHETAVLSAVLEPEEAVALTEWCHRENVTVSTLLGGAFLFASGESGLGVAVSLRELDYEGLGNYAAGVSINYFPSVDTGFSERIRELHGALQSKLDNPDELRFLLRFTDSLSPTLIDGAFFAAFGGLQNPAAARSAELLGLQNISPRGVNLTDLSELPIPTRYGSCRLRSLSLVPPLVPGCERLVGSAVVEGRMTITMHYDRQRQTDMEECFRKAIATLKRQIASV